MRPLPEKIFGGVPYFFYKQADGRVKRPEHRQPAPEPGLLGPDDRQPGKNTGGWPVKIYNIWLREK